MVKSELYNPGQFIDTSDSFDNRGLASGFPTASNEKRYFSTRPPFAGRLIQARLNCCAACQISYVTSVNRPVFPKFHRRVRWPTRYIPRTTSQNELSEVAGTTISFGGGSQVSLLRTLSLWCLSDFQRKRSFLLYGISCKSKMVEVYDRAWSPLWSLREDWVCENRTPSAVVRANHRKRYVLRWRDLKSLHLCYPQSLYPTLYIGLSKWKTRIIILIWATIAF